MGPKISNHGLVLRGLAVVESDGPQPPSADTEEGNNFLFSPEKIPGRETIFCFPLKTFFCFPPILGRETPFCVP
jgi:hypothetical protein